MPTNGYASQAHAAGSAGEPTGPAGGSLPTGHGGRRCGQAQPAEVLMAEFIVEIGGIGGPGSHRIAGTAGVDDVNH